MAILIIEVEAARKKEKKKMVIQKTGMAVYIILMKSTVYI